MRLDRVPVEIVIGEQRGFVAVEWLRHFSLEHSPEAAAVDYEHFVELGEQVFEFLVAEIKVAGLFQQVRSSLTRCQGDQSVEVVRVSRRRPATTVEDERDGYDAVQLHACFITERRGERRPPIGGFVETPTDIVDE